jgi:hypothetical protein
MAEKIIATAIVPECMFETTCWTWSPSSLTKGECIDTDLVRIPNVKCRVLQQALYILDIARDIGDSLQCKPLIDHLRY